MLSNLNMQGLTIKLELKQSTTDSCKIFHKGELWFSFQKVTSLTPSCFSASQPDHGWPRRTPNTAAAWSQWGVQWFCVCVCVCVHVMCTMCAAVNLEGQGPRICCRSVQWTGARQDVTSGRKLIQPFRPSFINQHSSVYHFKNTGGSDLKSDLLFNWPHYKMISRPQRTWLLGEFWKLNEKPQ